jgi:transcriptional regulator with XRE-family HTH domain
LGEKTVEETFGERLRGLRIDAGFAKQASLARLIPSTKSRTGYRHSSWLSRLERDELEPDLADLAGLARALGVSVNLLVLGDEAPDSEFVDRMRGYEAQLDERGKRSVLAVADREIEEARLQGDAATQALIDAGYGPDEARRAVAAMRGTAADPDAAA